MSSNKKEELTTRLDELRDLALLGQSIAGAMTCIEPDEIYDGDLTGVMMDLTDKFKRLKTEAELIRTGLAKFDLVEEAQP